MIDFETEKEYKIDELINETTDYIFKFYPDIKQKSDLVDKEYFENYLKLLGINEIDFRKDITNAVINIYSNNSDFNTELKNIINNYPNFSNDNNFIKAIEQLLKIAIRVRFVQEVKYEYYKYLELINSAATTEELEAIDIKFNIILPL